MIAISDLQALLDQQSELYNQPDFIAADPVSIPHLFERREDREIAGFLVSLIAWGKRNLILRSGHKMMEGMEMQPFEFVCQADEGDLAVFDGFVHRTFNAEDMKAMLRALQYVYREKGGLSAIFDPTARTDLPELIAQEPAYVAILNARNTLIESGLLPKRTHKHLSNPLANASAKRLNMFLRWMVRRDNKGVDFGLWEQLSPADLVCPLDVHTGNVGRQLGLLSRKQDDLKAALELTHSLRHFCPEDPVRYDFALFGMGVNGTI